MELYQLRDVVELERVEAPDVEEDSSLSEVVEALSRQLSDLKERVDRVESDGDAQPPENGDAKETGTGRPLQGVISIDPLAAEDWARRPNSLSSGGHYAWLTRTGTTEA